MTSPPRGREPNGEDEVSRSHPSADPQPIRPLRVLGGFVIGAAAYLFSLLVLVLVQLAQLPSGVVNDVFSGVLGLGPLVVAVGLLMSPRTFQAGAGLLLGVAFGTIVSAGLCIVNWTWS